MIHFLLLSARTIGIMSLMYNYRDGMFAFVRFKKPTAPSQTRGENNEKIV